MASGTLASALTRLRDAADTTRAGWLPPTWSRVKGPGPDAYAVKQIDVLGPLGSFEGSLALEPNGRLVVACDLDVPAVVAGVPVVGEPLELTLWSIFPIGLEHVAADGTARRLFDEEIPPAASGPALLVVVPELAADAANGRLVADVRTFDTQVHKQWNWFGFTTPGLRARFEALDLAWARLHLADAVAATDAERKAVHTAAHAVPEGLLDLSPASLDAALLEVATSLGPVAPKVDALRVHLVGHSHIDMNWLWTWPDTKEVIKRDFRSILSLMADYPEMRFTHSQPATYEVIRTDEPQLFGQVLAHIADGRWEPATMQWVEGDTNMAGHEATARQALEGVWYAREELAAEPQVFLAPDTFGHAGNLPAVTASAGTRVYYHHRCNPGHADGTVWPAYWWEGQDGTRVLAVSTWSYNGHITAGDIARSATYLGLDHGHEVALCFYGVGDHGGGPTRESLDTLRRLQDAACFPSATCSTVAAYASDVAASGTSLPVHRGESVTTFEGCYTTHADSKRFNREGENLLQTADALTALAGVDARTGLQAAWRTVLFNQFHDIFDGSAIAEVYRDQGLDHEAVVAAAQAATTAALAVLHADVPEGRIAVTNQLGTRRTEAVHVPDVDASGSRLVAVAEDGTVRPTQADGAGVWFVADVAGWSTASYELREATAADADAPADLAWSRLDSGDRSWIVVTTPLLEARIRTTSGIITSLVDRTSGHDFVARGKVDHRPELAVGVLQLCDERPHEMSSWDLREVHTERSLLEGAQVRVVEQGPLRLVVEVVHAVRSSTVTERLVFHRGTARIDVELDIDWREPGNAQVGVTDLKLSCTTHVRRPQAWFETPFGAVERAPDGQEVPALRWAAVAGDTADVGEAGIAVLNRDKHGYDALGSRLRLTLVRTAYDPDAASDVGRHRTGCAVLPFTGSWDGARLAQAAASYNEPLVVRRARVGAEAATLLGRWSPTITEGTVVVAGAKVARTGRGRVMRLFESTGATASVALGGVPDEAEVWEVSTVEDRLRRLDHTDGVVHLDFRPWQVRTVLVD